MKRLLLAEPNRLVLTPWAFAHNRSCALPRELLMSTTPEAKEDAFSWSYDELKAREEL